MKLSIAATAALMVVGSGSASSQGPAGPISLACLSTPATPAPAATPAFAGTTRANLASGTATFENSWASSGQTRFHNVIEGPPGKVRLTLETCSSASGGETVAIYPATASGERVPRKPRVIFSIAVRNGNVRNATAAIPAAPPGASQGTLQLVAVVENASGKFHQGAYRLTVTR